jgi:hypothetical protein
VQRPEVQVPGALYVLFVFALVQFAAGGELHATPEHKSERHWPFEHPNWQNWDDNEYEQFPFGHVPELR